MAATFKFKTIWYSFLQSQNGALIQKSIKHVNNNNSNSTTREATNEDSNSTVSASASSPVIAADDYRLRRERNNESVRKSRAKNRLKMMECASRVEQLRSENTELNKKLGNLQSELFTLKGLFQYCFSFNLNQLAVKPSDIPTSTLHQVIMENKSKLDGTSSVASCSQSECTDIDNESQLLSPHASSTIDEIHEENNNNNDDLTETDYYNITQIKNALCNIVKSDDSELETPDGFMDLFTNGQQNELITSEQYSLKDLATMDHDYLV